MHALIDGDILVYTAGFSAQKKDPETKEVIILPVEFALANTKRLVISILEKTGADDFSLFLTAGGKTFRDNIATIQEYKGNRKKAVKPVHYSAIREYLINTWGARLVENEEADDMLGILQYRAFKIDPDLSIICTVDKDLLMIPGWHYNIRKETTMFLNEEEAITNFYCQLITGDSTDNIPGLKGYGDKYPFKKARKYLEGSKDEEEMYKRALAAYEKSYPALTFGQIENRVLEIGRLLWILREPHWAWRPPTYESSKCQG